MSRPHSSHPLLRLSLMVTRPLDSSPRPICQATSLPLSLTLPLHPLSRASALRLLSRQHSSNRQWLRSPMATRPQGLSRLRRSSRRLRLSSMLTRPQDSCRLRLSSRRSRASALRLLSQHHSSNPQSPRLPMAIRPQDSCQLLLFSRQSQA